MSSRDIANHDEVEALLRRGGWSADNDNEIVAPYDPLRDPPGAHRLAELLADVVRSMSPDVLVLWEGIQDIPLGFAVALSLKLPIIRAMDAEGLIVHEGGLPDGAKAVLLGIAFRSAEPVLAVSRLIEKHGGTLIGVASVIAEREPLPIAADSLFRPTIDSSAQE